MPTTAEIADAVVTELNAGGFAMPFTAVRAVLPLYDLGEMSTLHVTVVPAARVVEAASRSTRQIDHRVDVAVQQKVAIEEQAAVDPLIHLVDAIAARLSALPFAALTEVAWVKTEHTPLIAHDHLHELRQFTSVIAMTYRTWEPR